MVSDAYLFCFNSVHNSRQSLHLAVGGHIVSRLRKLLSEGATGAADSNLAKNMRAKVTLQNMFQGALCSLAQSRWRRIHFAPLLSGLRFKQKFKQTLNSKRTCRHAAFAKTPLGLGHLSSFTICFVPLHGRVVFWKQKVCPRERTRKATLLCSLVGTTCRQESI